MERRVLVAIGVGALGLVLGVFGATTGLAPLAATAGLCALAASVLAGWALTLGRRAEHEAAGLKVSVSGLSDDLEEEIKRRSDAESKLASRIQLTAMRRGTEGNALTDGASGLLSEGYFTVALDARISTARRNLKPVAVVLMEVIAGLDTSLPTPADPARVARSINETIRESDTACRLLDGGYALVLEDTTENGAIWTAERIRRAMEAEIDGITLWAGVACYPAHGLSTEEVLDRADLALDMAREWRQDRIEIATLDS